jgi:hypothetical protein
MKRSLSLVVLIVMFIAIGGIAGVSHAQAVYATNVSGNWSGTTRVMPPCNFSSGRCNAVNKITFKFVQHGDRIKGKYTCAYGNLICRNGGADNTGKIVSGRLAENQIRLSLVIPSDVSNCYYNGALTSATTARGGYACYNGGDLVEEGVWDISREPTE